MKHFEAWALDNPLLSFLVLASALFASFALAYPGIDSVLIFVWIPVAFFAAFSLGRLAFYQLRLYAALRESEHLDAQLAELSKREDVFWEEITDSAVAEFTDRAGVDPEVARKAVAEKVIELRMEKEREHLHDELDMVERWVNARGALRDRPPRKNPTKES